MTDYQLASLRALVAAQMPRQRRLRSITDLIGVDATVALVNDWAEKLGVAGAIDRFRLPEIETLCLIEGRLFVEPVRQLCGARTRAGTPCKRKPVPGKRRCPNHGGIGAKTPEALKRQGDGLRAWQAARRAAKAKQAALTGA